MTAYTPIDRILAAWKGERRDRVPFNVDIGPHYSSVMNYTTDDYFGNIETAIECQVKSVSDYTSDIITVPQNLWGWFALNACYRFRTRSDEVKDSCIKSIEDVEDLEAMPVLEIEGIELMKKSCNKIDELTPDHAARVALLGPIFDAARLAGLEDWIVNTQEVPEFIHKLMRLTTDATKARALEIIKGTDVLIIVMADTFASISNISPKIYREFVFPYEMELFQDLQKATGDSKIIGIHICGFVDPIMEDISQLPIDWVELDGPSSLKKMFEAAKGKMIIRGNIGGEIFSDGTKEDIYEAVKQCLEIDSGSNKYVLSTGCQIPLNAPLDQVRHFIDAAQKYGTYS
jgi:uroporphyrinogen-III decarboxylase